MNQPKTEAAMSDHRFEKPLDPSDVHTELSVREGNLCLETLKGQAEFHADKRVAETLKRYRVPEKCGDVERANALAERVLGLLVMSRYRRGPVQFVQDAQPDFIAKIRDAILNDRPIELILSFFGSKVRNPLKTWATEGTEVDISEMASLLRFYEIAQAIKGIYPVGAVIHVACDGRKYADAIGFTEEQGRGYFQNIASMGKALGIGDCVHLFDEADHYPVDIKDRARQHLDRVESSYHGGDVAIVQAVSKLRTSMCLSMPIDTEIDVTVLRLAFSRFSDDELAQQEPRALEVRRYLLDTSLESTMRYIAVYDAVKEAGVIDKVAPQALRATVHPKPGQLGLYAINQHANGIFPHHGQGTMRTSISAPDIEKVRIGFRADLERVTPTPEAVALPKGEFQFSNGKHPFVVLS